MAICVPVPGVLLLRPDPVVDHHASMMVVDSRTTEVATFQASFYNAFSLFVELLVGQARVAQSRSCPRRIGREGVVP